MLQSYSTIHLKMFKKLNTKKLMLSIFSETIPVNLDETVFMFCNNI